MIRNALNYLLRITLIIAVIFSYLITPEIAEAATAETLGDLRKEYEQLLAEKQAYDNKTEAAKQEIERKKAAINEANKGITDAEDQYEEAELAIVESNEKIVALEEETKKVLLYMQQMQGQNAYVEYVSGASSMTELIMRVEAVNQVTGYIQTTTKNLEEEIKKNEQLKVELEEKKVQLENQIVAYQEAINEQYDNIDEYSKFSESIEDKVISAKNLYENYKGLCQENAGSTADSVLLSSCTNVPVNSGWLKPLNSGVVSSPKGYRTHPTTGQVYSFHNAVDIAVSEGTKIYAAAAGIVKAIYEKTECGGNKVYIQVSVGGQNYTTYYYHLLNIYVKEGDVVTQNTVIGTVGGYSTSSLHGGYDTCTTGAHLHFGVAEGWYKSSPPNSKVIVPPGFKNAVGYRFYSRTDYYYG